MPRLKRVQNASSDLNILADRAKEREASQVPRSARLQGLADRIAAIQEEFGELGLDGYTLVLKGSKASAKKPRRKSAAKKARKKPGRRKKKNFDHSAAMKKYWKKRKAEEAKAEKAAKKMAKEAK